MILGTKWIGTKSNAVLGLVARRIIIIIIIPTAPRIPPHHPAQREERRGVMSLVGQLLKSLSCLVAKLCSVLGCSLVE